MKKLELSKSRNGELYTALVDNDFYEIASQRKWYMNLISGRMYAATNDKVSIWKYNKILLHRAAYEFAFGKLSKNARITFVNGDTLDCRAVNLKLIGKAKSSVKHGTTPNTRKMVTR